ncbi:MAG: DUF839 domain-containing protein [Proteobacteria bacterium]|nr:DUF839 domain-containing protein [Pseudomonadota bacterium]
MGVQKKNPLSLLNESQLKDDLILTNGLEYKLFLSQGDSFGNNLNFGSDNDFIAHQKISETQSIFLFNHESPLQGYPAFEQQKQVGVSLIVCQKGLDNSWTPIKEHPLNRRIDGTTEIPFSNNIKIKNKNSAIGTLANCAGGKTPWGTFLTCEENFHAFYTAYDFSNKTSQYSWELMSPYPSEHYGWVVEINPLTGQAQKHTSLGRFCHEGATVTRAKNGMPVVYMGDDSNDQFIYKFISNKKDSLEDGELFVADTVHGKWLSLDINKQPQLQKSFSSQIDLLIQTRKAALLLGATPQDRPEDIEVHPETQDVYISLTNNFDKARPFGAILKIKEKNSDAASLEFEAETFVSGGADSTFACPDNLCFDRKGNLWMTNDISENKLGVGEFKKFPRNGLYYIPLSGPNAGQAELMAYAPPDAELTGPCFAPDHSCLFLSVQHPGIASNTEKITSHWPKGGNEKALSSVVTISGPRFQELLQT